MDKAIAQPQIARSQTQGRDAMSRYENTTRHDNLLCGGLLAVAMAWLALSAVQVSPAFEGRGVVAPAAVAASAMGAAAVSEPSTARNGRAG